MANHFHSIIEINRDNSDDLVVETPNLGVSTDMPNKNQLFPKSKDYVVVNIYNYK